MTTELNDWTDALDWANEDSAISELGSTHQPSLPLDWTSVTDLATDLEARIAPQWVTDESALVAFEETTTPDVGGFQIVSFPKNHSCGTVLIRFRGGEWRIMGEAKGDIVAPVGFELGLRWSSSDPTLMDLDGLRPMDLKRLELPGRVLSTSDLQRVARLRGLTELDLSWTNITVDGLAGLAKLHALEWLRLSQTALDDESAAVLLLFTGLRNLSFRGTRVGDRTVEALAKMTTLRSIDLAATRITDVGLGHLGDMRSLEMLDLSSNPWPRISPVGLRALSRARNLTTLRLAWTDLNDRQLSELSGFTKLVEVDLSGTRATDACLVYLAESPLRRLTICSASGVTNTGLLALRNCAFLESLDVHQTSADNLAVFSLWTVKPACVVNGMTQAAWRAGAVQGRWSAGDPIMTPAI